jgi:AraC family transcriptional regulator
VTLSIELKPVEQLVFRSEIAAIGTFRCSASEPMFRDSGPCTHHTFVFPRTSTIIRHHSSRPFTATPNCATLYNQRQEYTRTPVSAVDASDWYVIADDVLFAAIASYDPAVLDCRTPFRRTHVPISAATYIEQRRLFDRARAAGADRLDIDERVLRLLGMVLDAIYGARNAPARDAVESVKDMIAAAPARIVPLRTLAASAGISPFHLCRAFRRATGMSVTAYRHSLRLRTALDLLRQSGDLSDVALQLGYSSHSHFTAAFRRQFGITPSAYRESAR